MKKLLFISVIVLSAQAMLAQNSEKFTNAMKATIAAMDTSFKNPSNLLTVANKFERIAPRLIDWRRNSTLTMTGRL